MPLTTELFSLLDPELTDGAKPPHAVLAYLFAGSATSSEIGDAVGLTRKRVWELCSALAARGFIVSERQHWTITRAGRDKFRRFVVACNFIANGDIVTKDSPVVTAA